MSKYAKQINTMIKVHKRTAIYEIKKKNTKCSKLILQRKKSDKMRLCARIQQMDDMCIQKMELVKLVLEILTNKSTWPRSTVSDHLRISSLIWTRLARLVTTHAQRRSATANANDDCNNAAHTAERSDHDHNNKIGGEGCHCRTNASGKIACAFGRTGAHSKIGLVTCGQVAVRAAISVRVRGIAVRSSAAIYVSLAIARLSRRGRRGCSRR